MTYAFVQDVPADENIYGQIRPRLGTEPPKGLVVHLAIKHDNGLRYIDVWQTEPDWERFRDERVEPAVSEVLTSMGIPDDHSAVSFHDIEVIDVWVGTT